MQNQFAETYNKLCQCISKPITQIAMLNANTLSHWTKNADLFEELTKAKKPEDLLWTQMKLANISHLEAINYAKKVSDIWSNAITEMNELYGDMIHETTTKASEVIKSTSKTS